MAIFFRINNNVLTSAGEVKRLGFKEEDGLSIPDEYLDKQEFVVMRTCHGIGDWCIISAMPRLLKEKYPNSTVYVPSSSMLKKVFGNMLNNWGYGMYDCSLVTQDVFANNPYVDQFIDEYEGEIFHDHYKIYDETNSKVPLVEQMLKFWQFTQEELYDSTPDIYFSKKEIEEGNKIIKELQQNNNYGYLALTSTFGNTSDGINLVEKAKEFSYINNWFYYGELPLSETSFSFLENVVSVKELELPLRMQMYLKTKAKVNIGNESGTNLWQAKYSESYILSHNKYGKIHGDHLAGKVRKDPYKSGNYVKNIKYI